MSSMHMYRHMYMSSMHMYRHMYMSTIHIHGMCMYAHADCPCSGREGYFGRG